MPAANTDKLNKVGNPGTATTLSAPGYTIGAASINVGSTANFPSDTGVIFAIDTAQIVDGEEQRVAGSYCVFVGTVASATSIDNLQLLSGTPQNYSAGALTRVYITVSAVHTNRLVDALLVSHDQDGTLRAGAVDTTAVIADGVVSKAKLTAAAQSELNQGWISGVLPTPNTVTYNGNRSYDLVFNSTDLTDDISPGQRLRLTRTVTAPTQCADLESGSSQYFSKTSPAGMTFTDDFTVSALVKLESFVAGGIIARRNADTEGWSLSVAADGRVTIGALRIAGNNSATTTYQSIPLNKWVHVAASVDLSGTSVLMYIDGVLVPSLTTITGTITALVQGTTALVVGAEKSAGTNPFDGKIAQAAVFSSILSAATIRSYMSQGLAGTETSLVSAYSLNNTLNDLNTTNANNLTANGGALATNADTPFTITQTGDTAGTLDYAIVQATSFSTNTTVTVQVPEGNTIPTSGGVSTVVYSSNKVPYNFPAQRGKWVLESLHRTSQNQGSPVSGTWYNVGLWQFTAPIGEWIAGYSSDTYGTRASGSNSIYSTLSTANNTESDKNFTGQVNVNPSTDAAGMVTIFNPLTVTTQTVYYKNMKTDASGMSSIFELADRAAAYIRFENAYL